MQRNKSSAAAVNAAAASSPAYRASQCTLPPRVRGQQRGRILISVSEVVWYAQPVGAKTYDTGTTLLRMKWWGEQGEGMIWRPQVATMDTDGHVSYDAPAMMQPRGGGRHQQDFSQTTPNLTHTVDYPIVVSSNTLTNYLNDAQWLVFEIYHFLESDPSAIHRDYLKMLQRQAHPNRALPLTKQALGHIMYDLSPLSESLTYGELEWSGSKNLPILVHGIPVGQVSVKVVSVVAENTAVAPAAATGEAPVTAGMMQQNESISVPLAAMPQQSPQQQQPPPQPRQAPSAPLTREPSLHRSRSGVQIITPLSASQLPPQQHDPFSASQASMSTAVEEGRHRGGGDAMEEKYDAVSSVGSPPVSPARSQLSSQPPTRQSSYMQQQQHSSAPSPRARLQQQQHQQSTHQQQSQPQYHQQQNPSQQYNHPAASSSPSQHHPHSTTNDPYNIDYLISQSEDMSRNIEQTIQGVAAIEEKDIREYIEQQTKMQQEKSQQIQQQQQREQAEQQERQRQRQQREQDERDRRERENQEQKYAPRQPSPASSYQPMPTSAAPFPFPHSTHQYLTNQPPPPSHLTSSGRSAGPFSSPPPFAGFTPAPSHYFPEALPILPMTAMHGPPFPSAAATAAEMSRGLATAAQVPVVAVAAATAIPSEPVSNFIDSSGLITLFFHIRRITFYHSSHDKESRLGGRSASMSEANAHAARVEGLEPHAAEEVEQVLRRKKDEQRRKNENVRGGGNTSSASNSYMVLHWQFFSDLLMTRSPPLHAPVRGLARPAYFHCTDSTPRVFSRTLLTSLSASSIPMEIYAYKRKPSWKDVREQESGRYVINAAEQLILGRMNIPLAPLLRLPTSASTSSILAFLSSHLGLNTILPIYDPHQPSPLQIGEVDLSLGWGNVNDIVLYQKVEAACIVVQKCVRGFLARRRERRKKIQRDLEEVQKEEAGEKIRDERKVQIRTQHHQHVSPSPVVPSSNKKHESHPERDTTTSPPPHRDTSISPPSHQHQHPKPSRDAATITSPRVEEQVRQYHHHEEEKKQMHSHHYQASPPPPTIHHKPIVISTTSSALPTNMSVHSPPTFMPAPSRHSYQDDRKDFISYTFAAKPNTEKAATVSQPVVNREAEVAAKSLHDHNAIAHSNASPEVAQTPLKPSRDPQSILHRHPTPQEFAQRVTTPPQRVSPTAATTTAAISSTTAVPFSLASEYEKMRDSEDREEAKQYQQQQLDSNVSEKKFENASSEHKQPSPLPSKAPIKKDPYLLDDYSDVDVSDDDDIVGEDDWQDMVQVQVSRYHSNPAATSSSTYLPVSISALTSHSFFDAGNTPTRSKLRESMRELEELEERMKWKLNGKTKEEWDRKKEKKMSESEEKQATLAQPQFNSSIHIPLTPTTPVITSPRSHAATPRRDTERPSSAQAQQQAPTQVRTPVTPRPFLASEDEEERKQDVAQRPLSAQQQPSANDRHLSPIPPRSNKASPPLITARAGSPLTTTQTSGTVPLTQPTTSTSTTSMLQALTSPQPDDADDENDSDVSVSDEESENDEEDTSRWGLRVRAHNVDVHVQYTDPGSSAAAGASSSTAPSQDPATTATERSRLFPHGLRGEDQPGSSSTAAASTTSATSTSTSTSSQRPQSWRPIYHLSDEDAERMERIARIMRDTKPEDLLKRPA